MISERTQTCNYWKISSRFMELLEFQFPINDRQQKMIHRSVSDFAGQLSVPLYQLRKAIIISTRKTPKKIITERIMKESKALLKMSDWSISEISYSLGFMEETRFNNFFKDHIHLSPSEFRSLWNTSTSRS